MRIALLCCVVLLAVQCTSGLHSSASTELEVGANPLAGQRLYAVPTGNAANERDAAKRKGDKAREAAFAYIAAQPQAAWFGDWDSTSTLASSVSSYVTAAAHKKALPQLVLYNIMNRDLGQYSAGGAHTVAQYQSWVNQVIKGIGSHKAIVVLVPDAIMEMKDMQGSARSDRVKALTWAVKTLSSHSNIALYIDAGGPYWDGASDALWPLLREVGLHTSRAAGFAINTSNFQTTADCIAFGKAVSAHVGNKHFIIDTSRNGKGAIPSSQDSQNWCNPPHRGLGSKPTTSTGEPLCDAFLWIKTPGESDGTCKGGPPSGQWWAAYAYGLYKTKH